MEPPTNYGKMETPTLLNVPLYVVDAPPGEDVALRRGSGGEK